MRRPLGFLAALFLIAHVFFLSPTLEDIDSINFALGVRDFDVAQHQPHPPGYPVFIALGKSATAALRVLGVPGAEPRALGLLSALAGATLVILLYLLFRAFGADRHVAWWAMGTAACSPLLWFTALRPLSDMTGLALVVAAQTLLLWSVRAADGRPAQQSGPVAAAAPGGDRQRVWLLAGAALTGFAAGLRIQTVMLTAPLLLGVLLLPGTGVSPRNRLLAVGAAAAGAIAWLVPLLVASGGPGAYLAALGTQAGEDFAGVVMLWTHRQPRVAANAVLYSFVWPWGSIAMGAIVLALAAVGFGRAVVQQRRTALLLLVAFAPYAVFHLLFHETITVRYALPLVVPVAFLAAYAAGLAGRLGVTLTAVTIIVASLVETLPAARAYGRDGSPSFRVFESLTAGGASNPASAPAGGVIGMHAIMRRVEEWMEGSHAARVLRGRHGREWLALVEHWRKEPESTVHFVADPRRTDLMLFDPQSRSLYRTARWSLPELPFIAGTRPGAADLYLMRPPGWMLGRGWALSAEIGGITARDGVGPHVEPSVAWVRARAEPAAVIVGGRNLGGPGDAPARLTLSGANESLGVWEARPGFFLWQGQLPAGTLLGTGYVPLRVSAAAADGSGRQVRVSLEQFDLQTDGTVMTGFGDGWYEPEYDPATARAWRWTSERSRLWVRPVNRAVRVTIAGEDPLRYFDHAPEVRLLAAGIELARFTPSGDFTHEVTVPAKALQVSGGLLTLESELWFTPSERGESADPRRLALRIYSVSVR